MANWAIDPRMFVPKGFTLEEPTPHPPLRQEVYVTGCYTLCNEDLAIVRLELPISKEDFGSLASALQVFFQTTHQLRVTEILPCPLGEAFVRFGSALEREVSGSYFHLWQLFHDRGQA
jgi:hypothetical protein